MNEPQPQRKPGRPKTGRKLARYFLRESVIARIQEQAHAENLKRPADLLERMFG